MSTQLRMTQSSLNQLERLTGSADILQSLRAARSTRGAGPRSGPLSYVLTLPEGQRARLAADVAAALNEHGYDGGDLTACGHVYEGLLAALRESELADA